MRGGDVHRSSGHITVMDEPERILRRKRVSSSREGLREALGAYPEPIKAVVEATNNPSWPSSSTWAFAERASSIRGQGFFGLTALQRPVQVTLGGSGEPFTKRRGYQPSVIGHES
jgi:hypothetical protein